MAAKSARALTPRQLDVYDWIERYILEHGCGPTLGELAAGMGLRIPTVYEHVLGLVRKGALEKTASERRGLAIAGGVASDHLLLLRAVLAGVAQVRPGGDDLGEMIVVRVDGDRYLCQPQRDRLVPALDRRTRSALARALQGKRSPAPGGPARGLIAAADRSPQPAAALGAS